MGFAFLPTSERHVYTPQYTVLELLVITVLQVVYWQSRKLIWDWSCLVMAATASQFWGSVSFTCFPWSTAVISFWRLLGVLSYEVGVISWCLFLFSNQVASGAMGLMDPVPLQSVNDLYSSLMCCWFFWEDSIVAQWKHLPILMHFCDAKSCLHGYAI